MRRSLIIGVFFAPLALTLAFGVLSRQCAAQAVPAFSDGQKVEIREGDTWSPATVLKKEGRRYLIHYEGGDSSQDEWVMTERMRPMATPVAPPASPPGKPSSMPPAMGSAPSPMTAKPVVHFATGEKIEFKSWWDWKKGVIINTRGKWYFVQIERDRNNREWVEPWRIRKAGSTEDGIGNCDSWGRVNNGEGPPREDPGDPPLPNEWTRDALKRQEHAKADQATPLTPGNRTGMVERALGADPGTPYKGDPEPKPIKPLTPRPVVLIGGVGNFFEHVEELFVSSPEAGIVVVPHVLDRKTRLERVDAAAGRTLNVLPLPGESHVLDLSPDGKLIATRPEESGNDRAAKLTIWNVESADAKQVISFAPFDDLDPGQRDVAWARFVDPEHIVLRNNHGHMMLWDALKARAIWRIVGPNVRAVALTPGRRQIVALATPAITVIDAMTGQTLRAVNSSGTQVQFLSSMCIKSDGTQLAVSADNLLTVYDLVANKAILEFNPKLNGNEPLSWVADRYILANYSELLGLDEQMLVWLYGKEPPRSEQPQPAAEPAAVPGKLARKHHLIHHGAREVRGIEWMGRYWYVSAPIEAGKDKPVLTSIVLPDEYARSAIANRNNPTGEMAIKPGVSISLEVNIPDDIREKVTKSLRGTLMLNGLNVVDGQPIKLVAACDNGPAKEMIYAKGSFFIPFGPPPANATHLNVTPIIQRLAFVDADGQTLWERKQTIFAPGAMRLKEGQSIEDAVAEAMKPKEFFFTRAMIPKLVPKASQLYGFGWSQLTAQGAFSE